MPFLFYHITRSSVAETARSLMERALQQGWRVMVRGTDPQALDRLDQWLWLNPEDGFLPHGLAGGAQDADQPVLLGAGAITNGARALMLIDGATADATEAAALERVWVLFDGNDEGAVADARTHWKAVAAAGQAAQYWSEDGGRWEKKAEKLPD
jgi:DNA polymerase-3 subunit chi